MKIYFDKLYRYDRLQEPAGIALPFKEGELKTADRIAITQNGRKCMVQPKVTSKHADGSIRYLYVDFLADIPSESEVNHHTCVPDKNKTIHGGSRLHLILLHIVWLR